MIEAPVTEVDVYVRKGHSQDQRRLAFILTSDMDQLYLIDNGYAIDGNQAVRYINLEFESLLTAQRDLVDFLQSLGYRARFV